jgi:hypothetical protein
VLARRLLELFSVEDPDMAALVADNAVSLERAQRLCHGGATYAEQLCQRIVCNRQGIATSAIAAHE